MVKKKKERRVRMFEGLPVIDATKDIVLEVTKSDVENSKKKNPGECAAARAGARALHTEVKVYLSRMYVKSPDKKKWIRFLTPNNAAREIVSFDRGSSFIPGEYVFKAATAGQQLGYQRGKIDRSGKGSSRTARHISMTHDVRITAREGWHHK